MMSATSRLAMASAVGILLSLGSAKAADLGGNCCADLEERVAELEATTVRKGNRKVSLTLTGQIDKEIMYYGDSVRSRTIAGTDNINSSTRFWFAGDAKISSSHKAGFEMMVEWSGANRSDLVSQLGIPFQHNFPVLNASNISGDGSLAVRTANWWLEDSRLGRVTVGRVNIQGPSSTIDVSGADVSLVAWNNVGLQAGGFYLQRSDVPWMTTSTVGPTTGGIASWCYGCSRDEGIRWDSPSIGGLLLGAYWGSQDRFTVQARYANEFNGVQVAAGAGYQHDNRLGAEVPNGASATQPALSATTSPTRTDVEQQGYALSAKHVASGLFIQGMYGITHYNYINGVSAATLGKTDGRSYHIQGGWAKNVFGVGMSSIYGEYGHGEGYATQPGQQIAATTANTGSFQTICGNTTNCAITSDSLDYYGMGVTQKIDSAAMTLYLGWRHFDPKASVSTNASGAGPSTSVPLSSFDTVIGGARILF
jgi:hypothetical protein